MQTQSDLDILEALLGQARGIGDTFYRCQSLAEIAAGLAFCGDRPGMAHLWEEELERQIAEAADEKALLQALGALGNQLVRAGAWQTLAPLWQRIYAVIEGFAEPKHKSWGLSSLTSQLLLSRDAPHTCDLLLQLLGPCLPSLRQDYYWELLIQGLIAWLGAAGQVGRAEPLWELAGAEVARREPLPQALLLASLAGSQAAANRLPQARDCASRLFELCPQCLADQAQEAQSRLLLALYTAAAEHGPAGRPIWDLLLDLLPRVPQKLCAAQLEGLAPVLARSGAASLTLWEQFLELAFAIDEPVARAKAITALALAMGPAHGHRVRELLGQVLSLLEVLNPGPSRNLMLVAMSATLAELPLADTQDAWERIGRLLPAKGAVRAEAVAWQAVALARDGQRLHSGLLLDEVLYLLREIGWGLEKQIVLGKLLDILIALDLQAADAELMLYYTLTLEYWEQAGGSNPRTEPGFPLQAHYARLLREGKEELLLASLGSFGKDVLRVDALISVMEELIQTRALSTRSLGFYLRLDALAERIEAEVSRTRTRVWIATGLNACGFQVQRSFEAALELAAGLTGGMQIEMQMQLLIVSMVSLGICRGLPPELWDRCEQLVADAAAPIREPLQICLAGALAMSGDRQRALRISAAIATESSRSQALCGIAQVITGAGGR